MHSLWQALGVHDGAVDLLNDLAASKIRTVSIEGPPRTGKSWLAKSIGASWLALVALAFSLRATRARPVGDCIPFDWR
jgi:hypothetical protein